LRREAGANVEVVKFKGATAKGLTRAENANRQALLSLCQHNSYRAGFFSFGQVDIHFSFFFDLAKKKSVEIDNPQLLAKMYSDLATNYIDFVASLPNISKKIVLAVYPSPVDDDRVPRQLLHYGILTEDEVVGLSKETWFKVVNR